LVRAASYFRSGWTHRPSTSCRARAWGESSTTRCRVICARCRRGCASSGCWCRSPAWRRGWARWRRCTSSSSCSASRGGAPIFCSRRRARRRRGGGRWCRSAPACWRCWRASSCATAARATARRRSSRPSGRIALRWAIGRGLLSLVIVAMGASLGREGALVYFGAAAGSWLGRRFQLDGDQLKLLVACGASAGIAAAYNTPIGGALFGLEVFLGGLALALYGPIIFAPAAATLISRALLVDHPSYENPHYRLTHPAERAVYLAVGVVLGGVSALFVRTVELTSRLAKAVRPSLRRVLPIFALGLVGVVGIFYPEVYGNGYDTVNLALAGTLPLTLLVILPVLKLVLSS